MTLYHYTHPARARMILETGLKAKDPDWNAQPSGAYLSADDRWGWFGDTVLAVEVSTSEVKPDPYYESHPYPEAPGITRAYYVPGEHGEVVVPPERIRVHRAKNLTPR